MMFKLISQSLIIAIFLLMYGTSTGMGDHNEDTDDILPDVQYLYEEPTHYLDPHDMFADFDSLRKAKMKQDMPNKKESKVGYVTTGSLECSIIKDDLDTCRLQLDHLQGKVQSESAVIDKLQKRLSEGGQVDYHRFYRRALTLLWNALNLEAGYSSVTTSSATGATRVVSLYVSAAALADLHACLSDAGTPQQCDEGASAVLQSIVIVPDEPSLGLRLVNAITDFEGLIYAVHSVYTWMYVVGSVLLLLTGYVVSHALRGRRWLPTVMLICFIIFCCLWNWRNMIREAESRRAADGDRRAAAEGRMGSGGVPKECVDRGWWDMLWGAEEKCNRYYEDMFLSASEEITPEKVISRTFSNFILHLLLPLGKSLGGFFNNFFGNISFWYMIPASVLLVVFLLIICGYSVEFPLFMGGIRPGRAPGAAASSLLGDGGPPANNFDIQTVTRQLQQEQQQFLLESHRMMLRINEAALESTARAQMVQPILASSYHSIEQRLDALISSRLNAIARTAVPLSLEAGTVNTVGSDLDQAAGASQSTARGSNQGAAPHGVPRSLSAPSRESRHHDSVDGSQTQDASSVVRKRRCLSKEVGCAYSPPESGLDDDKLFYGNVSSALDESLNISSSSQMEHPVITKGSSASVHNSRRDDVLLSPASKKFLYKVRDVLES